MARIRPLAPDDRAAWQTLWDGYLTFYEATLPPDITDRTFARLLEAAEPMHALVAVDGDRLVGLAHYLLHRSTWADRYCYLEDLFADPHARGQGVGRALIEAVAAQAREAHAARLYWVTRTDNATARKLYDRVAKASDFVQYRMTP